MKRMPLLLLVVLLMCVMLTAQALEISPVQETDSGFVTADGEAYQIPAETEGYFIPGFTCYPVQCSNFSLLLPMEWECFATDPGYPAVVAKTPDEGMLMVAEFGAEMDPLSAKDHYAASFLQEGRDLFAGKTTEDSKLLDTFLLDGLPALQVEMVGQGFEMVWVNDQGNLYFLMYQTGVESLDANMPLVIDSFYLREQRTAHSVNEADYETEVLPDGTLAITAYIGNATHIRVPQSIGGVTVTQLAPRAFYESYLREVILPDSITAIGGYAFSGCTRLVSIRLPAQLEELPAGTFESCFQLSDVQMPDSLKRIGESAFYGCFTLEELRLPAALEHIANHNFILCRWLERFEVPADCVGFTTQDDGAVLLSKDGKRLVCYAAWQERTHYSVPEGVETVDVMAFDYAGHLETVVFPQSIRQIGGGAFGTCVQLQRVELPVMDADLGIMPGMLVETDNGLEKRDGYISIMLGAPAVLVAPEGGTVQQHAEKFDIPFEAIDTTTH